MCFILQSETSSQHNKITCSNCPRGRDKTHNCYRKANKQVAPSILLLIISHESKRYITITNAQVIRCILMSRAGQQKGFVYMTFAFVSFILHRHIYYYHYHVKWKIKKLAFFQKNCVSLNYKRVALSSIRFVPIFYLSEWA